MNNETAKSAIDSLDWLSKTGFFGETSKKLLQYRNSMTSENYYYEVIASVYAVSGDSALLTQFALKFMQLFTEGLLSDGQQTVDILTALMVGNKDTPGIETISSYTQYLETMQSYKNEIASAQSELAKNQNISVSTKIILAKQLIKVFDEGFEYDMKIMAFMLAIMQLISKNEYNIPNNLAQPSANKIKLFKELDSTLQYSLLTERWDTIIRNADSHINLRYDVLTNVFIGKNQYKKNGKVIINNFRVTPESILTDFLPRITNFLQGFLVAAYMLLLSKSNQTVYKKAAKFLEPYTDRQ